MFPEIPSSVLKPGNGLAAEQTDAKRFANVVTKGSPCHSARLKQLFLSRQRLSDGAAWFAENTETANRASSAMTKQSRLGESVTAHACPKNVIVEISSR